MGEGNAGPFDSQHIQTAIYSDLKEAEITYILSTMGYRSHFLHVNFKGLENDKTQLDAYVYFPTWKPFLSKIKRWAEKPEAACEDPNEIDQRQTQ